LEQPFNFPIPEVVWPALLPMIFVALGGVVGLLIEMFKPKKGNNLIAGASVAALVAAGVSLIPQLGAQPVEAMGAMVMHDRFAVVAQLIIVLCSALCVLFSEGYLRQRRAAFGEFYPLLLFSTVGAMMMASTLNLLMMFVGLEVLSLALYVMAGLVRRERGSEESAMKYFLLGAFASGFFLYGIAFVYGATGGLNLAGFSQVWVSGTGDNRTLLLMGLALMLVGLGFKASLVPFHLWTPDVYQGAPTNVASYMATVSKIGAFAGLWRILDAAAPAAGYWFGALSVVAILTMLVGNLVALTQRDVKRILAYSSVGHAGYILVALLANSGSERLPSTVLYYLLSYGFMTIGAFAVVSMATKDAHEGTRIEDLRGLWRRSPIAAVALVVCMLSLIGLPPTAGFVGKLMIFNDAIAAGLTPLAIVLAVSSAISVYYYLAIATAAFATDDEQATTRLAKAHPGLVGACVICIAGIIAASILFTPLMSFLRLA
jgi:NADH-quinone oxidoreductase subunit N